MDEPEILRCGKELRHCCYFQAPKEAQDLPLPRLDPGQAQPSLPEV